MVGRRMVFSEGDAPLASHDFGEEGVGVGECSVYVGNVELVESGKELPVDLSTADNENFFVGCAKVKRVLRGGNEMKRGCGGELKVVILLSCDDDVTSMWQRSLREGTERVAAHDDDVSHGERFESRQVARNVAKQLSLLSDGKVVGYGGDGGESHRK